MRCRFNGICRALLMVVLLRPAVTARERTDGTAATSPSPPPLSSRYQSSLVLPAGRVFQMTFKSRIDGSARPLLVKLPADYDQQKPWPLLVTLHGLGDGPILAEGFHSMVQIGPYGRGSVWYTGIGREDVFECIDLARQLFSIDADRIYLCGFSMGAMATFDLGLSYPDIWAACVPVCGRCDRPELIANATYLPFWINAGTRDTVVAPEDSRKAWHLARRLGLRQWRYPEHRNMGHSFDMDFGLVERWLAAKRKIPNPKKVTFRTFSLNASRAYWVEITAIQPYGSIARIEAEIHGARIDINTTNVANYTLNLNPELIDIRGTVQIRENGILIFDGLLPEDGRFVRRTPPRGNVKRPGLCGPLWEIYTAACVLVYSSNGTDASLAHAARRCAQSFADPRWMDEVNFPIVADSEVTPRQLRENNVVLFGNSATNRLLAEIAETLPVQLTGNCVRLGRRMLRADRIGYVLIFPSPFNPRKYLAVFAGNTAESINCFHKLWPEFNSTPKDIDFGVFKLNEKTGRVQWLAKGLFDMNWRFREPPQATSKGTTPPSRHFFNQP